MEQDETGTLARLKSLRSEVFDPRTKQFDGRIFKNIGDGALPERRAEMLAEAEAELHDGNGRVAVAG